MASLGPLGTLSVAGAASHSGRGWGTQAYFAHDLSFGRYAFSFSTQRSFGAYDDLGSVTAVRPKNGAGWTEGRVLPPKALDRVSLSFPLFDELTRGSVGFARLERHDLPGSKLVTASLSRYLPAISGTASLYGYMDLDHRTTGGIFASLSFPLDKVHRASVGTELRRNGGLAATGEVTRWQAMEIGTYGYRAAVRASGPPSGTLEGSYRSSVGLAGIELEQSPDWTFASGTMDGAVALTSAGLALGNRSDTSFAVVKTGLAGVPVLQDHRTIGETGPFGTLLVPNIRSWDANEIAIDAEKAPADFVPTATQATVVPRPHSGVVVNFGSGGAHASALVFFVDGEGEAIPRGLRGQREGTGEAFVVGDDGRVYLRDIDGAEAVAIDLGDHTCHARVDPAGGTGPYGAIKGVPCL